MAELFNNITLGLVKGRHEMPSDIDAYVFNDAVVDPTDTAALRNTADNFFKGYKVGPGTVVVIYVTGLTPALIAVINAAKRAGAGVIMCKHWNRATNTYFTQGVL